MKKFTNIFEAKSDYIDNDTKELLGKKLTTALAEEINAWYAYFITYNYLRGTTQRDSVAKMFEFTAQDELEHHARMILNRLNELGLAPLSLTTLSDINNVANHKYIIPTFIKSGDTDDYYVLVTTALRQNIEAEKGAIDTYKDLERFTRDIDPVTNKLAKELLEDEEHHLSELSDFLNDITIDSNDKTYIMTPQEFNNIATISDYENY